MLQSIRYLSRADVTAAAISPALAREAIDLAFRAHATARNISTPKLAMNIAPGHAFQAMCAASPDDGIAAVKWLGMAPVETNSAMASIQATICLNDYQTGAPLAIMDGDVVTLLRTAAMSATAAHYLAPRQPRTIGFIGCGAQARYHLDAFRALYPDLSMVLAYSRSIDTANAFAAAAREQGMDAEASAIPEDIVKRCDIVITTVPNAPGFVPFLDARWLKPDAFVASVDVGRSWLPAHFDQFKTIATDSLTQGQTLPAPDGSPLERRFDTDLVTLAKEGTQRAQTPIRSMFHFRGFALADLALACLVYDTACQRDLGTLLPR